MSYDLDMMVMVIGWRSMIYVQEHRPLEKTKKKSITVVRFHLVYLLVGITNLAFPAGDSSRS